MPDITEIDKNFKVDMALPQDNIKYFSADSSPFKIYGLIKEEGQYRRMPKAAAESVSAGVAALSENTAGGRVRFVTNSNIVVIKAIMPPITRFSHMPLTGTSSFDLYVNEGEGERFVGTYVRPYNLENGYEGYLTFGDRRLRTVTINFPLYSSVNDLFIGIEDNATLDTAKDYKYEKPIVYYGSSITQGGCASRAGNSYEAIISRRLNCNYINLGFSGSALAEDSMTDYIKGLDMSVFVYDYDHNAPNVEHLKNTHEKLFKAVRAAHPDLPVVMMTRPNHRYNSDEIERLAVVKQTFDNAVALGDKNVYFIDGRDLIAEEFYEACTVDGCHPTDGGFVSMANVLLKLLKEII